MATAAVSSNHQDAHINKLHSESLPQVDLRLLSQSELLSLSFSSSSLNNHRGIEADVATLKIDRSVFNESAGSRKQTFYKLRLAPRNSNSILSPSPSITTHKNIEVPQDEDNSQIVGLLKSLFGSKCDSTENEKEKCVSVDNSNLVSDVNLMAVPIAYNESFEEALKNLDVAKYGEEAVKQAVATDSTSSKKRKRGRPRINAVNENEIGGRQVIVVGEQQNQVSVITDSKRKRGRPRKDSSTLNVNSTINVNLNQERPVVVVEKEVTVANTDSLGNKSSMWKNSSNLDADNVNMGVDVNEDVEVVVVMNEVESGKNEVESGKNEVESGKKEVRSVKKVVGSGKKVESGGGVENWYGDELRKRTMGMQTQAEVFGALEGMEGEWMSKRKKRKIVDASLLGDALPRGWRLMLSNKRRASYFWLDCTGYIRFLTNILIVFYYFKICCM